MRRQHPVVDEQVDLGARRQCRQRGEELEGRRGNPAEAKHEYGVILNQLEEYRDLDGLIVAVSHKEYVELGRGSRWAWSATRAASST
jgi:hypothetical protein